MLLTERKQPFDDAGWTYELKYDGYRLMAWAGTEGFFLKSRGGTDATGWFPEVPQALQELLGVNHRGTLFDGEVCVLDEFGRPDFNKLHERGQRRGWSPGLSRVVYCIFDALVFEGRDLRTLPLVQRKARLLEVLPEKRKGLLPVQGFDGEGRWLYAQVCQLQLEGIVAKRKGSPYVDGIRSSDWVKVKRPGATPAQRFKRDKYSG